MGGDPMKPSSGFTIICIFLILSGITGSVAADAAQYEKSVSISMHIDNGKITPQSTEIYYGSAPHLFPAQEGFTGELVAADGSTVKTFAVWDPRVQLGDAVVSNSNGPAIQGVVDRQNSADFVVIVPFDRNVTEFRMYNSADGTLLASVNLKPKIDSFFASYPNDPDNPALYGLMAPVTANPPGTSTPDSSAVSFGQLHGILAVVFGAVMLLGGGFASVRFLRTRSRSVLIVDDNRDIIEVIAGMLGQGNYTTRAATSGEECLRKLESAVPDLILLDIGMEPMDGWETLKQVKKNPGWKNIPVIMLTARKLIPKDVEDYGIFIEDYIVKPVTSHGLDDAITHVFARQQMIREKIAEVKSAGIDRDELCECARLTRVVDVNKRLWDLLVKTYDLDKGIMQGEEDETILAIRNIEGRIRDQENRLEQIRRNIGSRATS
jgi:two-component system, OmpR family, response regulator